MRDRIHCFRKKMIDLIVFFQQNKEYDLLYIKKDFGNY